MTVLSSCTGEASLDPRETCSVLRIRLAETTPTTPRVN